MSFGKRGPVQEKAVVATAGPIARGSLKTVTEAGDAAIDTMKKVVLAVGGLVTLFVVYMLLPSSGPPPLQLLGAVNAKTIPNAPLMAGRLEEATDQNFDRIAFDFSAAERNRTNELVLSPVGQKVRDACLPRMTRQQSGAPVSTPASNEDWTQTGTLGVPDIHPWAVRTDYARGTEFLRCALLAEPQRFCEPHFRLQLVEHLTYYAILHNMVVNRAQKAWAQANPDQAKVQQTTAGGATAMDQVGPAFDRGIGQAISEATRFGYLSAADFGAMDRVPRVLRTYFQPQREVRCAPPAPAPPKKA